MFEYLGGVLSGGLLTKLTPILWDWFKRRDVARLSIDSGVLSCLRDPVEHEERPTWKVIDKEAAEALGIEEASDLAPGESINIPVYESLEKQNSHYFAVWVNNTGKREIAENCQAELAYIFTPRAISSRLGLGQCCCWMDNWAWDEVASLLYDGSVTDSIDIKPGGRAQLAFVLSPNGLDPYPHPNAESIRSMSVEEYADFYPDKVKVTVTSNNAPPKSRTFKIRFGGKGFFVRSPSEELRSMLTRWIFGPVWRNIVRPIRLRMSR